MLLYMGGDLLTTCIKTKNAGVACAFCFLEYANTILASQLLRLLLVLSVELQRLLS